MKNFIVICLLLLVRFEAAGQVYRSYEGSMVMILTNYNSSIVARNDCVVGALDYETGQLYLKVAYETFYTGIHSIDSVWALMKDRTFEYKGVLNVPYINTQKHQPETFEVNGSIISDKPYSTLAKGTLTYVPAGLYTNVLTLDMQTSLSVLDIKSYFPQLNNSVQIYIQQAVLKRMDE